MSLTPVREPAGASNPQDRLVEHSTVAAAGAYAGTRTARPVTAATIGARGSSTTTTATPRLARFGTTKDLKTLQQHCQRYAKLDIVVVVATVIVGVGTGGGGGGGGGGGVMRWWQVQAIATKELFVDKYSACQPVGLSPLRKAGNDKPCMTWEPSTVTISPCCENRTCALGSNPQHFSRA